jgi:hypothetical protein
LKSNNEALAVLEARIRSAPTKYVGLATGTLDTPVECTNVTHPGYTRVAVTYANPAITIDYLGNGILLGVLANTAIAIFAANSGAGPWPSPKVMMLFDALTGGSHFRRANLANQALVILPGQSCRFAVGALVHTEK